MIIRPTNFFAVGSGVKRVAIFLKSPVNQAFEQIRTTFSLSKLVLKKV
jgi:hypothetical protein